MVRRRRVRQEPRTDGVDAAAAGQGRHGGGGEEEGMRPTREHGPWPVRREKRGWGRDDVEAVGPARDGHDRMRGWVAWPQRGKEETWRGDGTEAAVGGVRPALRRLG